VAIEASWHGHPARGPESWALAFMLWLRRRILFLPMAHEDLQVLDVHLRVAPAPPRTRRSGTPGPMSQGVRSAGPLSISLRRVRITHHVHPKDGAWYAAYRLRTMSAATSDSQRNTLRDSTSIPPLAQVVAAHRQEPPASVCKFPRRDNTRTQVARHRTDPGRERTGPRCKGPMRMYSRRSE